MHKIFPLPNQYSKSSRMSQPTTKPTILFVHGAWHNASCWDATREELHKLSYSTHAVQLKSAGNTVVSHREDTTIIRDALESLTSEEKHVVLVMHSYGGKADTNVVSGLELAAREQRGQKGGIMHCVFLAAFLIPKGKSLVDKYPGRPAYIGLDVSPLIRSGCQTPYYKIWLTLVRIAARGLKISRREDPQRDILQRGLLKTCSALDRRDDTSICL